MNDIYNLYLVYVRVFCGAYEKTVTTLVIAPDETMAGHMAMGLECHSFGTLQSNGDVLDGNGEFGYRVDGWTLIDPKDAPVLRKYRSCHHYDEQELKELMS